MPTRVALVTPTGRGAVASIVVFGGQAVAVVESMFRSASDFRLAEQPIDRILYGRWSATGEEVVVARRGVSKVEIHCHGGSAASQAIVASLNAAGCQAVSWQEFVRSDERNPLRFAARIALAGCASERTAAILLDQYQGALDDELANAIRQLERGEIATAITRLRELLAWGDLGKHLTTPWRVVLAGPANVGKSTLINALVGYQRAIVFDQPGTTRDVVTVAAAIDGWPVELADTAGLRAAGDQLEQAGVARARAELGLADLAILVCDVTQAWTEELQHLTAEWPGAIVVYNKVDLLRNNACKLPHDRPDGLLLSAKTGWNVQALLDAIAGRIVPRAPPPGTAVPFGVDQIEAIRVALAQAEAGDREQARDVLVRLVRIAHEH